MKTADALTTIKSAEKHLHGGGLSLPPAQLPFDLLLGAGAAAGEPSTQLQRASSRQNHLENGSPTRSLQASDAGRSFETTSRSIPSRGERHKSDSDGPVSDPAPASSEEQQPEDEDDAVSAAAEALVTPTAPASGQAPEATELLTTEDGAVLAEAMTIETPPKALIPNAKSAPVATTAETNDETEALAETPASQIASDATIPTAADGAATNGSGSAADRDISPAISAVQDERTLVTAGVAATGQEKEPELAALPVEAADPTTNEQGHDQPADEFDQPLTEGPTSESTAPPGDRVAEAKAPSATAEPPAAAPLQQTSPAAVTSAAVGASPAPPARVLPPVIARGEGEGIPAKPIEIDSTRLLHRVARAFHVAQQRGGDIKLRLNPPELGSLRLELRIDEGVMTARMETETSTARAAIMDSLPALRERLIEQGIRIERFDVDLMQQQGQGPGEKDQGTDWKRGRVGEWESGRTAQPHIESPHSLSPSPSSDLLNGLNVIV